MIKPIPCRCGSIPILKPKDPKREGNAWGAVECINPECPVKPCIGDGENMADERGTAKYQKAAIIRWNKWMA